MYFPSPHHSHHIIKKNASRHQTHEINQVHLGSNLEIAAWTPSSHLVVGCPCTTRIPELSNKKNYPHGHPIKTMTQLINNNIKQCLHSSSNTIRTNPTTHRPHYKSKCIPSPLHYQNNASIRQPHNHNNAYM